MPVSEALFPGEYQPWQFSVFKLRNGNWRQITGHVLNQTAFSAQGSLFAVGENVWAAWDEMNGLDSPPRMRTQLFVARMTGGNMKVTKVWQGRRKAQGVQGVVGFRGKVAVLYMRQAPNSTNTHAAVRFLP